MKIYLAGGFSVAHVKGRERQLAKKFDSWNRVFSFYWMRALELSQILLIIKEQNDSLLSSKCPRK